MVVDYEPLAVVDLEEALRDRVVVHDDLGTNRPTRGRSRSRATKLGRAAFAAAAHTVKERYIQQRLIPMAMEPGRCRRAAAVRRRDHALLRHPDPPHPEDLHRHHARASPSSRCASSPRPSAVASAPSSTSTPRSCSASPSPAAGVPVRWVEERTENAQATIQGRGQIQDIELAADEDGKLLAVRVNLLADMGGYLQLITPGIPLLGAFLYAGVYDIPEAYDFSCTACSPR